MSLIYSPRTISLSFFIAIFFLLNPIISVAQVTSSSKNFRFSLSAVAQVNTSGRSQLIPVVDNMVLQSGNLIKFYLDLEKEGYLYLFHEDSQGELTLLFPKDSLKAKVLKNTSVYIPEGNSWIELDSHTGKETFHLLVSAVRLERLENLYNHHVMLKERDAIKQSVESILNQIKSLKRENFGRQAEKPIRIAGKLRGNSPSDSFIPQELSELASEITTSGTYVKSVTIDHK
jgi:hypothetical protein